ncbi:periplasmic component, ABC-type Zn2+ transporter [Aurantimonas manganoxydans SI85-9A1]|uniref:High-affinity zinc uptake system protein ZnuA n=1 Tax=Aurantimonas manganoxydans (strain ATCC BAA-1229 / DSM 21871 / SI85-9A1) TaxID=287752 RepID=Q1YN41_AURMS|nr:zinc ABC transporter substrate-binding protein [Aurantimonas manganoxydans]EAS51190.1 periplasmic component, ABC-type Zn2+ transporter [Aurantimonas manganoxydans SI85-9A1]
MRMLRLLLLASATSLASFAPAQAEAPKVIASIKPVHSLVSSVMAGVGEPALLVAGSASPHTYAMKPSDAAALQDADIVFWVGDALETFLVKPIETMAGDATSVELVDTPGLETLPFREGGPFEEHKDEEDGHDKAGHEGREHGETGHEDHAQADGDHKDGEHAREAHGHDHGEVDMHVWLDPLNARAMTAHIASVLSDADPENAARYQDNAKELDARLAGLIAEIDGQLAEVRGTPFIVFHDAYQYFEHRFDVKAAGSITVSPDRLPGALRIAEIQAKVRDSRAACVFAEPQFEPQLVDVAIEGSAARSGVLDPEGASIPEGPELYFTLLGDLAGSLRSCLAGE